MEAVPRLPMIWFQVKVSLEPTTFGPKLKQYIRDFYNEDPESYNNEIHQLESLRSMAVRAPIDMVGCILLKKYYCQLHFLQSRFPMGKDGAAAVIFTWRDTYANMVCSMANIRFEMISILYNIGAIHSQLGASTERNSADGMKMACTHFQCAAWAFEHLKNSYPQPSGVDLAPELMTFMHQLCLAQAQECILEKSMLDNRKPTIVAKVARQIVDYFTMALNTLEQGGSEDGTVSDTVGTKIYKTWKRYVKFKKAYHLAVTYLYQGLAAEEQRKMGERVAFYNAALASLNDAHAIYDFTNVKEEKAAVEESLTFTNDVIEGKRKAAKNENEFIYHEEVPEKETLPTVKGASLVKGISFNINDPEVSGQDIFARLVPMKVHEASSLYSEEKAKILRSVGAKVEEKDQYLNTYLTSLKLEHMNLWDPDAQTSEWECLPLPEELVERCAALNAKQAVIQDLVDIMGKLSETSRDVERVLKEISKLLLDEEQKEKQYQDAVGKRPPSIVATDLTREAKKYEEAHNKASESNQALHKAITMHVKNLKILSQPLADLMAHIPSPSTYLSDQGSEKSQSAREIEKMHTKELKRILSKVDEMRMQRLDLHNKLRDQVAQDDLTRLLVTATSESTPLDRLFADQLGKHQSLVSLIEQNLAAQDNILAALTDVYAQTANVRKNVEEVLKRREIMISSLVASYDAYEDLLAKSSKGLEFYRKLEINVSKLLQRVKSTCKVQEEEREQILAQDNKSPYEKTDPAARTRSSNGPKLKDYLNSRVEGGTGYQNPYYNLYKGHAATMQMDSAAKSLVTDVADKTLMQSPTVAAAEIPSSSMKSSQHYYPASYDYRTNSPYAPYGAQNYYENPIVTGSLSQNYLPANNASAASVYQQPVASSTADGSSSSMQYPASPYLPNGQALPASAVGQEKFRTATHANYGVSNTVLQYDAYQSPATGYGSYNMATSYTSNQEKPVAAVKAGATEVLPNIPNVHTLPQMPAATLNTAGNGTATTDGRAYGPVMQTGQPYDDQQQRTTLNQEMPQQTLPAKDGTLVTNYADMTYPQNYQSTAYYNPADLQAQQAPYTHGTYDANAIVPPAQYGQSQQPVANSQQAAHSATSAGDLAATYSASSLHGVNPVQYPVQQQTGVEQSKQTYAEKTSYVGVYGATQVNPAATNYSSTYQTYQPGTDAAYQANVLPTDASNSYGYLNNSSSTEMIQSHVKSTTVQSYAQPYQYSHQAPYTGYAIQYPSYSQAQNYAYMPSAHGTNAMAYTYNVPSSQAQGYAYASNSQNAQTTQPLEATASTTATTVVSNVTASSVYQQQQQQQETNARYTNAGNNAVVSQTPSSQYSPAYQPQAGSDTYYTTPYGLQMQGQAGSVTRPENYTNYNQTYMQAVNNGTNTTTSANPMKLTTKSEEPKSNVDLLADLDITINHAPLVPEVRPLSTAQKKEETDRSAENGKAEKNEQEKAQKTEQEAAPSTEDKSDHENLQIVWDTWYNDVQPKKDPLGEPATLQKFLTDVEKYEKFVDSLLVKTLSGATNLDIKWKEVQDFEERENGKQSSTVASAHSSENRTVDCIPYDTTRVQISSSDVSSYINASHIMEITQWIPTAFIITQTPLTDKLDVFWTMVWEQESEVIACLASDSQLNGELYWPINEQDDVDIGNFTISLRKIVNHTSYIQRTLSVQHNKRKSERIIVHMQFLVWPSNAFPSSPGAILAFSSDVMTEQALRRCSPKPVVVHCLDGGSLSSLFLVAAATVCHIRAGCGIIDVPLVFKGLAKCRKQVVNKESLLFAYRLVLYHAQDILMKRGILSSTRCTFENFDGFKGSKEKTLRKVQCHPSDDFLHNLGVGMHRTDPDQGKTQATNDGMSSKSSASSQEKPNGGVIDPLSQLDPLWSIRR